MAVELHSTGYTRALALVVALTGLGVAYPTFVVIYIVMTGDPRMVFGIVGLVSLLYVIFVLLQAALVGTLGWIRLIPLRHAQHLRQRDPAVVKTRRFQPDRSLALRDGETLSVAYRQTKRASSVFTTVMLLAVFEFPFVLVLGEVLLIALLPVFGHSALNPLHDFWIAPAPPAASSPGILDCLCLGFPLFAVLVGTLGPRLFGGQDSVLASRIAADDQGISVYIGRRRKSLPWSDLALFARTSYDAVPLPYGVYTLWGRTQRLQFTIAEPAAALVRSSLKGQPFYVFEDGYETYQKNAERLLATIAARSSSPLLTQREMSLAAILRRRMPVLTTSEETAKTLPLAQPGYQLQVMPAEPALHFGEVLTLRQRPHMLGWTGEFAAWVAVLSIPMYFCSGLIVSAVLSIAPIRETDNPFPIDVTSVMIAVTMLMVAISIILPSALFFTQARRRRNTTPLTVDGRGITTKSAITSQHITISWQDMTAWVVIPPRAGPRQPTRYMVFGEGCKVAWAERPGARLAGRGIKGDRQLAYHAIAARIHTIIAERTGLPLRELRPDAPLLAPDGQSA